MGINNKIAVITGAGGVLCSSFAKCLAKEGAKVMLLDINKESADIVAKEIASEGGIAEAFGCNVLDKSSIKSVHNEILEKYGKVNILINGAGGNNPRATLNKEYYEEGDENLEDIKTFFNLEKEDFSFVFDLNLLGTLLPSQ
jgi:NAD(P)-dependent dehydrogenase (short-subunit alcohol dehydrogenase family)